MENIKKYTCPILIGEFRGFVDDSFEFVDKRHDNQIKKLYKRVYAIEVGDKEVLQIPCEQIEKEPLLSCPFKKGDSVIVSVSSFANVNGRFKCNCSKIELLK